MNNSIYVSGIIRSLTLTLLAGTCAYAQQTAGGIYPIEPVPFNQVQITDTFWKHKIDINSSVTIPLAFQRSEESGRIDNFRIAAGVKKGRHNGGRGFDDSDVFKIIEGAAYALQTEPDAKLEAYVDSVIYYISKAQEPDGYLYTVRSIVKDSSHRDTKNPKWLAVETGSHELYNLGHLYEAAVAWYMATGKKNLLDVAIKSANLVDKVFGWGKLELVPGHQEIEIGLVKLYLLTGEKRYFNLAKFFLDKRGKTEANTTYNQTHKPVTEQNQAVGHSVRALYMYAAMADVAAITHDSAYVQAMDRLWHDIADTKLYLIGGVGAAGGHEGFGGPYELPNLKAYNETCAAVANVLWNQRLFLMTGDARFIDVLELALYNNVISGVSLQGNTFFYPNRLASDGHTERSEWFRTSCCPSNIVRTLPSVPGYIYAHTASDLFVNLFISSNAEFKIANNPIKLEQLSALPWKGNLSLKLHPATPQSFKLRLRIPAWVKNSPVPSQLYQYTSPIKNPMRIMLNGKMAAYTLEDGYAVINRTWSEGDELEINFAVEPRLVESHAAIGTNKGLTAIQSGPVIYCIEGVDAKDSTVGNLMLLPNEGFKTEFAANKLNGLNIVHAKAKSFKQGNNGSRSSAVTDVKAIPYYAWANRGISDMRVWIPVTEHAVKAKRMPTLASQSRARFSKNSASSYTVNDLNYPENEFQTDQPNFNWWPQRDTTGWIEYDFGREARIAGSRVYWFNDMQANGGVSLPQSWSLEYKSNNKWHPVSATTGYPVNESGPSEVKFKPVLTTGLRLKVMMKPKSAGIYEWEILEAKHP